MKFAHYDQKDGAILGFYADDIHSSIPEPNIALSEEEWQAALITPQLVKDGVLVDAPPLPPAPELTIAEKLAMAGIKLEELRAALGLEEAN